VRGTGAALCDLFPVVVRSHDGSRTACGGVVEILSPEAVEVEFSDDEGRGYAMAAVAKCDLIRLQHAPLEEVA